jgi:RHS repeat-associated protein
LPHSPAINAGTNTRATTADQRGDSYPRLLGERVDMGAVESHVVIHSGDLHVYGTSAADGIMLRSDGVTIDTLGGRLIEVDVQAASSVHVEGLAGDDALLVDPSLTREVHLAGGGGNDLLQGGVGADTLVGGDGADVLFGADGDDSLYGAVPVADNENAMLNDGADTLLGDAGSDTFYVDYFDPTEPHPYKPSGGDFFEAESDDTVVADSGTTAPDPQGDAWQQTRLWDGNYGFGTGWNLPGIDRLEFTWPESELASVAWVRTDGHTVNFQQSATDLSWIAQSSDPTVSKITLDVAAQTFTRSDKFGNRFQYAVAGPGIAMVTQAIDRHGVGGHYTYGDYDQDGRAVEIESVAVVRPGQANEVTRYYYEATYGDPRVTNVVDPFGRTATIEYDGQGLVATLNLPEVSQANVINTSSGQNNSYRELGSATTRFQYDADGFIAQIIDADQVSTNYTWQDDGELWVEDSDPHPVRYLGTPIDVYMQWAEKTAGWVGYLPAFLLTDGLDDLDEPFIKRGYAIDEAGRTTTLGYNHAGTVVWQQDPTGQVTEVTRNSAGLPEQVKVFVPGTSPEFVSEEKYTYDTSYNLQTVTHFDGTQEHWAYDATFNQVTQYTDQLGDQVLFQLNTQGDIVESRVVIGSEDTSESTTHDDLVTRYWYHADGLVNEVAELRWDHSGSSQLASLVARYTYTDLENQGGAGHLGRRLAAITYGSGDASEDGISFEESATLSVEDRDIYGNPTHIQDELQRSFFFQYDALDRLILASTDVRGTNHPVYGQFPAAVEYDRSAGGRVNAVTYGTVPVWGVFDYSVKWFAMGSVVGVLPDPVTNTYQYDSCDCLTGSSQGSGSGSLRSGSVYNSDGTVVRSTGPSGKVTSYSYGSGLLPIRTRASGLTSRAVTGGQSVATSSAVTDEADETLYLTDAVGQLVAQRDEGGALLRYVYDARGRLVEMIGGEGTTQKNTYDATGQLVAVTDGEGRTTRYQYDDAGRLVARLDPGQQRATTYAYDTLSNLRLITDPLGNTTEYRYDDRSRLIETIDANGNSTTYQYWDDNQLKSLTDPNSNTTSWQYDNTGRLHTETNALGHTTTYHYDHINRLVQVDDRNGRTIDYGYDGWLVSGETWGEASSVARRFTVEYQSWGDSEEWTGSTGLVSMVTDTASDFADASDDHVFAYGYDGQGRLANITQQIDNLVPTIAINQGYDRGGRLVSSQVSVGADVDHQNSYGYDAAGRPATVTQTGGEVSPKHVTFSYNRASQLVAIERYGAATADTNQLVATSRYEYGANGLLSQLAHHDGTDGTLLAGYGYSFDEANRLTHIDFLPDGVNSPYDYSGEDVTYTYDNRGQLVAADYATASAVEEDYQYDANGNRIGSQVIDGTSENYSPAAGPNNQLVDDGTYTYTYDNQGNRLTRTLKSGTSDQPFTEYTWDHRNRLTRVTTRNTAGQVTETVTYDYDYRNQLIRRTHDPDGDLGVGGYHHTIYVYDRGQIVLQFEQTGPGDLDAGDLSHRYLWGASVDQLLADEQITQVGSTGQMVWALTDHQGTVRDLVDGTGMLQNHKTYDSYGNVTSEWVGALDTVFRYTGKLWDPGTGLQNNLHRWYDAAVGRWLSEDPIGFNAGDANLYRNVGNGPAGDRPGWSLAS